MTVLYHYTCHDHGEIGIRESGLIKPGRDGLVWMTDLDVPVREALGLTSYSLRCDRTAVRFEVTDNGYTQPWVRARRGLDPRFVADLEAAPGIMLMHWWVSGRPVRLARAAAA